MEKKYWQRPEFKELSKEWEKRLESEGLADIEKDLGASLTLKQNSGNVYRQMDPDRREAKELYFQQLSSCLHFASFDNEVDRIVMSLKAEGARITDICRFLWIAGRSRYRRTVRLIIRKYEVVWGVRNWTPNQLKYHWKKKPHIP